MYEEIELLLNLAVHATVEPSVTEAGQTTSVTANNAGSVVAVAVFCTTLLSAEFPI